MLIQDVQADRRRRLRLAIGAVAVLFGVALNVAAPLAWFDATDTIVAKDFEAYYHAAERMLAGSSPYAIGQLERLGGGYCAGCYLYPPFLAQLLSPMALLPLEAAKAIWLVIGYAAAFASTWLATGIGGAARSLERALWCLVAVMLFYAVASSVWVGNVGTLVALSVTMVALGGVAAGVGAGFGALIKVAPLTLLPAVFVAGRESRIGLVIAFATGVGLLFLLAPQAWLDYPTVLGHVFATGPGHELNLAVAQVGSRWGWGPDVTSFVRPVMVLSGAACVLVSTWLARQQGGMPAAALLGTLAMLIVPGALWHHYLAVLLPFAAMAWPRARAGVRGLLVVSSVLIGIWIHFHEPLLVYVGSALLFGAAGWVLWPRPAGAQAADTSTPPADA